MSALFGPAQTHPRASATNQNDTAHEPPTRTKYVYDGDGKRVEKSNGKLYWYGTDSKPLDETDLAGSTTNATFSEYVFFGGKRIARRDYQNNVDYYFADHLATARVITNAGGTFCYDADFYPFGGERTVMDTCDSAYKFTSKERDTESGLDNFGARYDYSYLGRFISPDQPLTDVDLAAPQSWNLYSYVRNNPLEMTDPNGQCVKDQNGNLSGDDCYTDFKTTEGDKPQIVQVSEPKTLLIRIRHVTLAGLAWGHHCVPRCLFRDLKLTPGARQILNKFRTGPLNGKHYYDAAHRAYNKAVARLMRLKGRAEAEAEIDEEQAIDIAEDVLESDDPEIAGFLDSLPQTSSGMSGREALGEALEALRAGEIGEAAVLAGPEVVPAIEGFLARYGLEFLE